MNLNSFKEAKRGRDGFFGKEERQPNRHGGLKKTIRENARSSSIDTNRSNSSAFKTTSNVGLDESSRVRASLAERLQLKHFVRTWKFVEKHLVMTIILFGETA